MLKLYRFLKPYSLFVIGVVTFVFLQTLADLYLPTLMSDMINNGVMQGDANYIMKIGETMLLIAGGGAACSIFASFLSSKTAVGLGTILRNKIFKRVESFSLHEFDRLGTATLITRTTNDINQIQQVTVLIMRMMISAPMMAIGGIFLAMRQDRDLTLVLAVAMPALALVIVIIASRMMPLFKKVQVRLDKINLVMLNVCCCED